MHHQSRALDELKAAYYDRIEGIVSKDEGVSLCARCDRAQSKVILSNLRSLMGDWTDKRLERASTKHGEQENIVSRCVELTHRLERLEDEVESFGVTFPATLIDDLVRASLERLDMDQEHALMCRFARNWKPPARSCPEK